MLIIAEAWLQEHVSSVFYLLYFYVYVQISIIKELYIFKFCIFLCLVELLVNK